MKLINIAKERDKNKEGEVFPQNSDSSGPRSLGEIEGDGGELI
jgi:hypothetical protein